MGFEIRFHWGGKQRHELHRWPMTRREVNGRKVLWDAGAPLQTDEWDAGPDSSIAIEALPPTADNHVQLLLRNHGVPQDFVVDVIDFHGIAEQQQQYVMKWRGYEGESRTIYSGRDALLDVAQASPPRFDSGGAPDTARQGAFRLFSTSLPDGWDVHAEDAGQGNPLDSIISLKIRVTGSQGANQTRRIRMGFSRPGVNDRPVWVKLDHWPEG